MLLILFLFCFSKAFEANKLIKEFPILLDKYFMVSIQYHGLNGTLDPSESVFLNLDQNISRNLVKGHVCSGVIINRLTILTAAHCIQSSQKELYTISINEPELNALPISNAYQVQQIITHENYQFNSKVPNNRLRNDLALIVLKQTLDLEVSEAIKLETKSDIDIGTKSCYTLGYNPHGTLIKSLVSLLTMKECKELIHNYWTDQMEELGMEQWDRFPMVYKGNICAWPQRCDTDTGGPLICHGKLLGIHNWGTRSEGPECLLIPSVYTSIPYFQGWIKNKTNLLFHAKRKFHFTKKKKNQASKTSVKILLWLLLIHFAGYLL